ncbi:MAG: hypothetical protein ACODAJ_14400, partial [Planctomycetota bacterium]
VFPSGHDLQPCDFGGNPRHRPDSYDLFSVGADGQTGDDTLPQPGKTTLTEFCTNALNDNNDGNGSDDIGLHKD